MLCSLLAGYAQTVTPLWTWMKGDNTGNKTSSYGTVGVADLNNNPGSRNFSGSSWTDTAGNLWYFGGNGYPASVSAGNLNDWWKFDASANDWIWMGGATVINDTGFLEMQGQPSPNSRPAARQSGTRWTDTAGKFWMFGGQRGNMLNDFWKFDPATNQWTWIGGRGTVFNQAGVYVAKGTPSATAIPGGRSAPASWVDKEGNFWMFGGYGCGNSTAATYPTDMWKFSPATGEWTWVHGNNNSITGSYGQKGVPDPANLPPGRSSAITWTDNDGHLWLFGGVSSVIYNDLWKYDIQTNRWTWMHGSSSTNVSGVYGTRYIPGAANMPGSRYTSSAWKDQVGNLWLFGGNGYLGNGVREQMNDLWKYDVAGNEWTWISGVSSGIGYAHYGTMGVPDPANTPGARQTGWGDRVDADGSLWLFGGDSYLETGSRVRVNDVWRFSISCSLDLGNDTVLAAGDQILLDPGLTGMPRTWNTGATTPTLTVTAPGTYWCSVNMPCGWTTDTIVIAPRFVVADNRTTCSNQLPYVWNGITVPAGGVGVARDTFVSASGGDSIAVLNLTVNQTSASTESVVICSNQLPFTWNGQTVTQGGTAAAVYTTQNVAGCDSVVTLDLTVNQTSASTESVMLCSSQLPYIWNGQTVTQGGAAAAVYTTQNASGCDSVVTLDLTVTTSSDSTVEMTLCSDELPYIWNGITVTQAGPAAAVYTTQNASGCDSVVTLNLLAEPVTTPAVIVTVSPGTQIAPGTPVTFMASHANAGASPSLRWRKNGIAVAVNTDTYTDNGLQQGDSVTCTVYSTLPCSRPDSMVSEPVVITVTAGIRGMDRLPGNLQLYPNPNRGIFTIAGTVPGTSASVEVISQTGQTLFREADIPAPAGALNVRVQTRETPAGGTCFVRIISAGQVQVLYFTALP